MQPKIIHYSDPTSLVNGELSYYGLVITAQHQMVFPLRKRQQKTFDIDSVLKALLPDWYDPLRLLNQHILLTTLIEAENCSDLKLLNASKFNKSDLLKSIRTLCEIGVETDCLPEDSEDELFFKNIYRKFTMDTNSGVPGFWDSLDNWNNPYEFKQLLEDCVPAGELINIGEQRAVYFQGFYYIRPLQSRLMDAVQGLDIPVFFINAFDQSYAFEHEVWKTNPYFKKNWIVRQVPIVEQAVPNYSPDVIQFDDLFSMIKYLRINQEKLSPLAPMNKDIRLMLNTFFPKSLEKENLMAYPIGRYLMSLFEMWDEKHKQLVLDEENVRACLSTGWAGDHYDNSLFSLTIFNKVHHYFRDCKTVSDWKGRLKLLQMVSDQILPVFRQNKTDRWASIAESPLENIGAFNAPIEDVRLLVDTLSHLLSDAMYLFDSENESLNLVEHFKKIRLLLKRKSDGITLHSEESQVIRKFGLRMELSSKNCDLLDCPSSQLAEAMTFFLGGKREDAQSFLDDDSPIGPVNTLNSAESVCLCSDKDKPILVCYCDAASLPGKVASYTWPLSNTYLNKLQLSSAEQSRLLSFKHYVESTPLSNRYLFHVLRSHPTLTVSWIRQLGNKILNPSVYIQLNNEKPTQNISSLLLTYSGKQSTSDKVNWFDDCQDKVENYFAGMPHCVEISASKNLCKRHSIRLIYDYGLVKRPCYSDSFHMPFVMTHLIALLSKSTGETVRDCAQQLFKIYPSFSASEKQEIFEFASRHKNKLADELINRMDSGATSSRAILYALDIGKGERLVDRINIKGMTHSCLFCPHKDYCIFELGGHFNE